jgi:glycosyltransferase involved in cell wall biosynthesis
MGLSIGRLRVALVSTAALDSPGSMRAYADTLLSALAEHAPDIAPELVELDPMPANGVWGRRLQTLMLPARARLLRRLAPDLWHVLDGSRAYVARALGPAPTIVTVHDIIPWLQANGRFPGAPPQGAAASALWRANGREFRRARRLACVSASTARDVHGEFGCLPERTQVVPLPLRPGMAARAEVPNSTARNAGVVLHVGNNGFYKNREAVLRIFSKLDGGIAHRLVLAGSRPSEGLQRLASELAIADRIEWRVDPGDVALAKLYQSASVLLHPSLYEGFGWPVLEAMAFGLPVVVSDAGSLREVVGDAAVCLPPEDETGLAAAVSRLLSSPELAAASSRLGLDRACASTSKEFACRMRKAYVGAVADARNEQGGSR